jgi:hypothetical protein
MTIGARRIGAQVRVHSGNSPGHWQSAQLLTTRLLLVASSIGGRPGCGSLPRRTVRCFQARSGPAYPWPHRSEGANWPGKQRLAADGQNCGCVVSWCRLAASDNGEGPSTHEMEGPARPRSATPLAHAQRPAARSAAEPDTRLRSRFPSSPRVRGAPRVVPVFGGERFLRLWSEPAQGVDGRYFHDFSCIHKVVGGT